MAVNTGHGLLLAAEELIPPYEKFLICGIDCRNLFEYKYF